MPSRCRSPDTLTAGGLLSSRRCHCPKVARKAGIEKLAPHDLRRPCARLCHQAGGELDQIQFLLGHVSVQTIERYLGCKQRIRSAVTDRNRHSAETANSFGPVMDGRPTVRERSLTNISRQFRCELLGTQKFSHCAYSDVKRSGSIQWIHLGGG